jgi:peptidoglycan/xylan/chitin deacetylase (PgdA/CDA1 family)
MKIGLERVLIAAAIGLLLIAVAGSVRGQAPGMVTQKAMISVEFDDGFKSAYDNGYPYFDTAKMPVTSCIITGRLNTPGYLSYSELRNLDQVRHYEICAHTITHRDLSTLDGATQQSEIQGSKIFLETLLGHPVTQFAYPFGNHNNVTVGTTMLAGFQSAGTVYGTLDTSTWPVRYNDGANSGTNPFVLPRFPMTSTTTSNFAHSLVDYSISHQKWIVFLFHRVDELGADISVTHEFIQDLIAYIQSKGAAVTIITRSQGIAALGLDQLQR